MKQPITIAITGACGQIAYSTLFRLMSGEVFGKDQPLSVRLLDLPQMEESLRGICMELNDACFPLLESVEVGSDPNVLFQNIDWALLIGAKPRSKGMERKDLLAENAKIFVSQGKALNKAAKPTAKVIVVGNPCNTNCLVTLKNAPNLDPKNFHALMLLDELRARFQLSSHLDVPSSQIEGVTIWGNHSNTQVPDCSQTTNKGAHLSQDVHVWANSNLIPTVQTRGAEVIKTLGRSSAASAAHATLELVKRLAFPTPKGLWYSSAVLTDLSNYPLEKGLIFGMPCRTDEKGECHVVKEVMWSKDLENQVRKTENELKEEKSYCEAQGLL